MTAQPPVRYAAAAVGILAFSASVSCLAQTNLASSESMPTNELPHLWIESAPAGVRDIYEARLPIIGQNIAYNRLRSPSATLKILHRVDRDGSTIARYSADRGTGIFTDALLDSLRLSAVDTLPLDEWRERGGSLGNGALRFLVGLFRGTVGNPASERSDPISIAPSYEDDDLERSWLRRARENGILDYGIRETPSLYLNFAFGHIHDRKPVLVETRCVLVTDITRLERIKLEERVIIPLFDSVRLNLGFSAYPADSSGPSLLYSASSILEHRASWLPWYVGAMINRSSGRSEWRCEGGFSLFRW